MEDLKDPGKVLLPTSDLVPVTFREDESGHRIPFTLLDDLPPDPGHGAAIDTSVSGSLGMHVAGVAYVVRTPIASRTDWLSSSGCLPFNLR